MQLKQTPPSHQHLIPTNMKWERHLLFSERTIIIKTWCLYSIVLGEDLSEQSRVGIIIAGLKMKLKWRLAKGHQGWN